MEQLVFLREHLRENERTLKREKRFALSKEEVSRLLNQVVMPTLEKIAIELKPYFIEVKTRGFVNRGRLLIQERRTSFVFTICVNYEYDIDIEAKMIIGTFPKGRNYTILDQDIDIKDFSLLTEEKIIDAFNNSFIQRYELTNAIISRDQEPEEESENHLPPLSIETKIEILHDSETS